MKLSELCSEYLNRYSSRFKKPKSCKDDQYLLDKYILPTLGKIKVKELKRMDIEMLHSAMKDCPRRANQMVVLLSGIYNKAIDWEYATKNPAKGIDYYPEKSREYLSLEAWVFN